jgi:hypothetical protein
MKSYSLFGVVVVSIAAMAAVGACTSSSTTSSGDDDSGTSSGGVATDSGSSSGTEASSGSSSGSTEDVVDAAEAAATCMAATMFKPPECDTCVKSNCCTPLLTCETDTEAGVDDAGTSACLALFQCAVDYAGDGGALDEAISACSGGDTSSAPAQEVTAVFQCATTTCSAQCD